jgi:hypothetical protein
MFGRRDILVNLSRTTHLQAFDHELEHLRVHVGGLAEGERAPVDHDHHAMDLRVLILDQLLQREEDGTVDGDEPVRAVVPVGGEEHEDASAGLIRARQDSWEAVQQCRFDARLRGAELLEDVLVTHPELKVLRVQPECLEHVVLPRAQETQQKCVVLAQKR